jgi:hypothetical protein
MSKDGTTVATISPFYQAIEHLIAARKLLSSLTEVSYNELCDLADDITQLDAESGRLWREMRKRAEQAERMR